MLNLSNLLSLVRFPLAFAFLSDDPLLRGLAIFLAGCTDCLDGYCARRFGSTSQVGAVLDPLADKFFVAFALVTFLSEASLGPWQMVALLSRDIAVVLFGIYLMSTGRWAKYQIRAIWCGKVATTFQLVVLMALTFHFPVPSYTYGVFVVLGILSLTELYLMAKPVNLKTAVER
jgi:CDP-diacylglycerol--glycerol-3-phosphate 3-phosphatidyltransferase